MAVANPFDTTRFPDGPHTLTAEFTFAPSVGGHVERMDTAMTIDNSRTDHGFVLGLSGSPDRTSAEFLDGASVGDEVFVFLGRLPLISDGGPVPAPGDGIDNVRFLLDGVLVQTERFAPYDLGGGTVDEARPFDLSALVPGSTHQLEARVRRSDGSSVPVMATFERQPLGFTLTTVDSGADFPNSIAIGADGLPVVSYGDKVAHCGNVGCTAGNTLTTIDGGAGLLRRPSIAIGTDGLPVVSYADFATWDLKVLHCGNVTCTAGNTLTTVDSDADQPSIAIGADGLPVLAYKARENNDFKIAHCGNVACTAGNTLTTVRLRASGGPIAIGTDGLPVVSYWDFRRFDLAIAHCGNVDCTAGNTLTVVDRIGSAGGSSIAIGSDGLPVVSYSHLPSASVKVAHCGDLTCTAGNTVTTLVNRATANSIAVGTDGQPVISYRDSTNADVKFAHCGNVTCTAGNTLTTVDSDGILGLVVSAAIGESSPFLVETLRGS